MSRRPNKNRRVTRHDVAAKLMQYDQHAAKGIERVLEAYHREHVEPLQEWARLPWWKRVFVRAGDE